MKKILSLVALLSLPAISQAEMAAYQATALNTPQVGYFGEVVCVQVCSTNPVATATVSSVTDLNVGGKLVSFTNELATVAVTNNVGTLSLSDSYVAPKQRIIVTGSAFPGGSAIIWLKR